MLKYPDLKRAKANENRHRGVAMGRGSDPEQQQQDQHERTALRNGVKKVSVELEDAEEFSLVGAPKTAVVPQALPE